MNSTNSNCIPASQDVIQKEVTSLFKVSPLPIRPYFLSTTQQQQQQQQQQGEEEEQQENKKVVETTFTATSTRARNNDKTNNRIELGKMTYRNHSSEDLSTLSTSFSDTTDKF